VFLIPVLFVVVERITLSKTKTKAHTVSDEGIMDDES
jgi:hypothetical protein